MKSPDRHCLESRLNLTSRERGPSHGRSASPSELSLQSSVEKYHRCTEYRLQYGVRVCGFLLSHKIEYTGLRLTLESRLCVCRVPYAHPHTHAIYGIEVPTVYITPLGGTPTTTLQVSSALKRPNSRKLPRQRTEAHVDSIGGVA